MVGPKKQDFWPRINILEGIFLNAVDELGIILENKVVQKLSLEKCY